MTQAHSKPLSSFGIKKMRSGDTLTDLESIGARESPETRPVSDSYIGSGIQIQIGSPR